MYVSLELEEVRKQDEKPTFLIIDTNLGMEFARRTGKDGYPTFYNILVSNPYPKIEEIIGGWGFEEFVKVDDWGEVADASDVIVFTDVGFGGIADYLRMKGKAVFGADQRSEKLETNRIFMRKVFDDIGVPMAEGKIVKGISEVVKEIEEARETRFVKLNYIRGSCETFGTDDPTEAKLMLEQGNLGPLSEEAEFVIEKPLDGVEVGIDTWFNGEDFQPIVAETLEVKGSGNITKFVELEDSIWYEDVLKKIAPWLEANGYRGMICFEGFYNGEEIRVIDPTCRPPYPCGYAYPKVIKNLPEVLEATAKGEYIIPEPEDKYSAQIGLYTDDSSFWREIHIEERIEDRIAFRRAVKVNRRIYYVPGDVVIAVAVSSAPTIEEAMRKAREYIDKVEAINSYHTADVLIRVFTEKIEQLKDLGYTF